MTEERIWQIYNFVNDWKNGKYGIMDIESCFNHYIGSEPIDEEELEDISYELADMYCKEKNCGHVMPNDFEIANDCIKIGYRAAK